MHIKGISLISVRRRLEVPISNRLIVVRLDRTVWPDSRTDLRIDPFLGEFSDLGFCSFEYWLKLEPTKLSRLVLLKPK